MPKKEIDAISNAESSDSTPNSLRNKTFTASVPSSADFLPYSRGQSVHSDVTPSSAGSINTSSGHHFPNSVRITDSKSHPSSCTGTTTNSTGCSPVLSTIGATHKSKGVTKYTSPSKNYRAAPSVSPPSSAGTPDSFNYETKFIVLNFLSQLPHAHVNNDRATFSPHVSTSDSDFLHMAVKNSRSRSVPTSPPKKRSSRLIHGLEKNGVGTIKKLSEDNIHLKYRSLTKSVKKEANCVSTETYFNSPTGIQSHTVERQSGHKGASEENEIQTSGTHTNHIADPESQNTNTIQESLEDEETPDTELSRSSLSRTQSRQHSRQSRSRTISDMSGDYSSYTSDADDEYEESGGGSLFSSQSSHKHHGGVDFLQVVSRLPTLKSESDLENALITGDEKSDVKEDGSNEQINTADVFDADNIDLEVDGSDLESYGLHIEASDGDLELDGPTHNCLDDNKNLDETNGESNNPSSSTTISLPSSSNTSAVLDRSKLRLDISSASGQSAIGNKAVKMAAVAASLRAELEGEMTALESEVEEAMKNSGMSHPCTPFGSPMTPQTEAAQFLARIGDEVKYRYEHELETAVRLLLNRQHGQYITYEEFRNAANGMADDTLRGWPQVALLLMYGQSTAWQLVENGQVGRAISNVVDYTTRLVADKAASFIIRQGGWGAVMNSDPSMSSSESPQIITPDSMNDNNIPPLLVDLCARAASSELYQNNIPFRENVCKRSLSMDSQHHVKSKVPRMSHSLNSNLSSESLHSNIPPLTELCKSVLSSQSCQDNKTNVNRDFSSDQQTSPDGRSNNLNVSSTHGSTGSDAANNNSYYQDNSKLSECLYNGPADIEPAASASDSDDHNVFDANHVAPPVQRRPWYYWLVIPEHITLILCTLAAVGVGVIMSRAKR